MKVTTWSRLAALCLAAAWALPAPAPAAPEPDAAALRLAARRTRQRLATDNASWSIVKGTGPASLRIDVVSSPAGRRTALVAGFEGPPQEILSIVERDGLWYVRENDSPPTKCRPQEYPFRVPSIPALLASADLYTLDPDDQGAPGAFQSLEDGVATYAVPVQPDRRRQMQEAVRKIDDFAALSPDALDERTRTTRTRLAALLERGSPLRVQVSTGILVERGAPGPVLRVENFRWLDQPPADALKIDGADWLDRSDGPLAASRDAGELVMAIHSAVWKPGVDSRDADGRILDLKSGRLWRIPFPGEGTVPGCFLDGRKAVAVTGISSAAGGYGLYRVDLQTRDVRPLGGETFAAGLPGGMALSPDGRTLAVVHIPSATDLANRQIHLLDLQRDAAAPLGKPIDVNAISWLPNGKGLIVVRTDWPADPKKTWTGVVCRIDLDGTVTELFPGADAVVLGAQRLLFHDQSQDLWKTCALDGKAPTLFGDGLKGHYAPAPSPDGRRILFKRNLPDRGPTLFLFNSDATGGTEATQVRGLWGTPCWR